MMAGDDDHQEPADQLQPMPEAEKDDYGFGKTAPADRVARYRQIVEDIAASRGTTPVRQPGTEPEA